METMTFTEKDFNDIIKISVDKGGNAAIDSIILTLESLPDKEIKLKISEVIDLIKGFKDHVKSIRVTQ